MQRPMRAFVMVWGVLSMTAAGSSEAGVGRGLAYPGGPVSAEEVARQVYFANHFFSFRNFSIDRRGRDMAVLITRDADGKVIRSGVERHLNNQYPDDDEIRARDLAVFHSGSMQGTGILVTEYADEQRSNTYEVWLPSLRKVRRFAEPDQSEPWGGSVFTFGDVSLRRPQDETHELLGRKVFRTCLGVIEELEGKPYIHVRRLPQRTCRHVGKDVYVLKSTTRFPDWWYDYRVSFVDVESFADYRNLYFKGDDLIKVIDRDWGVVSGSGSSDPRALFWKYWYGADLVSGRESWAVIPQEVVGIDTGRDPAYWSERTLRKLHR